MAAGEAGENGRYCTWGGKREVPIRTVPSRARCRGKYRAIVAVSHTLLVVIYHILRTQRPYPDLGSDYFERLDTARTQRHYVRRLEQLGSAVTLKPAGAA